MVSKGGGSARLLDDLGGWGLRPQVEPCWGCDGVKKGRRTRPSRVGVSTHLRDVKRVLKNFIIFYLNFQEIILKKFIAFVIK